jgi:hypothetical protein
MSEGKLGTDTEISPDLMEGKVCKDVWTSDWTSEDWELVSARFTPSMSATLNAMLAQGCSLKEVVD